ncbi:MAG: RNA methyltransferase substrate-binding domain-containing protein, partial [Myxococcota bacterium]
MARILELAAERGVPIERPDRHRLDKLADGRVHNGVIAEVEPLVTLTAKAILDRALDEGVDPLLVLADGLQYEHNLGAVLRSSLGFGVSGLVV